MKVSVAIPAFTKEDYIGYNNLNFLLNSVEIQDYKNIEIVVSDHSSNTLIKELCENKSNFLDIKYISNQVDRGFWGSNLNNAIKNCTGNIIKFMLQDDSFFTFDSISSIVRRYTSNKFKWSVCGGIHTRDFYNYYHRVVPTYTEDIYLGNNKIGGPSCVTIENNNDKLYFEKYLNWINDCDYYKRSYEFWGEPSIIKDPLIVYKQWEGQFTNTLSEEIKTKELNFMRQKYEKR